MNKHLVMFFLALTAVAPRLAEAKLLAYVSEENNNTVQVVDLETYSVITQIDTGATGCTEFSTVDPKGRQVYEADPCKGQNVFVIDTATNTLLPTLTAGDNPIGMGALPDGSRLYVGSENDFKVTVFNTPSDTFLSTIDLAGAPEGADMSPLGDRFYLAQPGKNSVAVVDTASNAIVTNVPVGNGPEAVTVSPDGSRVYASNNGDGNISVIDSATNTVIDTIPVGSDPYDMAILPDGTRLYVAAIGLDQVYSVDLANKTFTSITVGSNPQSVDVTPDGSRVVSTNRDDGTLSVIDTATDTVIKTVDLPGTEPEAIGKFIVELCGNGNLDAQIGGEACDDGNSTDGDGCSSTCQVETGFACSGTPSVCQSTCGDGVLASDEGCDDGNTVSGDGCSALCVVEAGSGGPQILSGSGCQLGLGSESSAGAVSLCSALVLVSAVAWRRKARASR